MWSYRSLRETGARSAARIDWWGNASFAVGLTAVLAAITYGIQPYGGHADGLDQSLGARPGSSAAPSLLVAFCFVETRVADPMFHLSLFRIQAFSAGNLAGLLASVSRGGLQFMLIIWLQGIWLPLHGYSFASTPLWAGIYLLPLTVAFLFAGPLSGYLLRPVRRAQPGDRRAGPGRGELPRTDAAADRLQLLGIRGLLVLNGIGSGLFSAPNTSAIMSSVPGQPAGRRVGNARHLPELGHVAVDRGLLHPDDRRAGADPARAR